MKNHGFYHYGIGNDYFRSFPEEGANGVNGIVIMLLYLLDTFLNILCELLISKQSRYNFLVSVLVEIV